MEWSEQYHEILNALVRQYVADSAKVSSITDTQRYNLLVATLNGLAATGVMPAIVTPADLQAALTGADELGGYAGVSALVDTHEADWGATWPVVTI